MCRAAAATRPAAPLLTLTLALTPTPDQVFDAEVAEGGAPVAKTARARAVTMRRDCLREPTWADRVQCSRVKVRPPLLTTLATHYSPLSTLQSLLTTHCSLLTTCYSRLATHYVLLLHQDHVIIPPSPYP